MVKHVPPLKWETKQEILEIDGVPTVAGLLEMKLARRTHNGVQISHQGHALMGQRMAANARHALETGEWHGATGKHPTKPDQPGMQA